LEALETLEQYPGYDDQVQQIREDFGVDEWAQVVAAYRQDFINRKITPFTANPDLGGYIQADVQEKLLLRTAEATVSEAIHELMLTCSSKAMDIRTQRESQRVPQRPLVSSVNTSAISTLRFRPQLLPQPTVSSTTAPAHVGSHSSGLVLSLARPSFGGKQTILSGTGNMVRRKSARDSIS
jgi:hypothetical protein